MAVTQEGQAEPLVESYYAGLAAHNVAPLWKQLRTLLPKEPKSRAVPHIWRYPSVREPLMGAGEVISAEEAERRVLMLMNPGLDPEVATTANLYAGVQLVLPGEIAPMHRHAAAALRYVIEGSGAYTAVDGERTLMQPGDLVLTPAWAWHDHGNQTDEPMIWLDGLDLPLINKLECNFFVGGPERSQDEVRPADATTRLYTTGRLNPTWVTWDKPYSPVVNYTWATTEAILREAARDWSGTPADGIIFEYTNPFTGGSMMPTMAGFAQMLPGGFHGEAHQHTTDAIYHVVRGSGTTIVDGVELEWNDHDTFAVPGWSVHEHVNAGSDPAFLFCYTDDPVIRTLGYYQERAAERQA